MSKNKYSPKCPTCNGKMWMDYESGSWGKDYYWKCSKKKQDNPQCPDKTLYWECDKCYRVLADCICKKPELYKREPIKKQSEAEQVRQSGRD